jgi:hypothetical protein
VVKNYAILQGFWVRMQLKNDELGKGRVGGTKRQVLKICGVKAETAGLKLKSMQRNK